MRQLPDAPPPIRLVGDAPAPDPELVDTVDLLAGIWLSEPPPADLHDGDVVIRLRAPADGNAARVDVELVAATDAAWTVRRSWSGLSERWAHTVAPAARFHMMIAIDISDGRALERRMSPLADTFFGGILSSDRSIPAPDALDDLIGAGLVNVGTLLSCGPHQATVGQGGVLTDGVSVPTPFTGISTVSSQASRLTGCTVNGWHVWRTEDNRLLNELRVHRASLR